MSWNFIIPLSLSICLVACETSFQNPAEDEANTQSSAQTVSLCEGVETETNRLFIEQVSHESVIVNWRGSADFICFGKTPEDLLRLEHASSDGPNKIARLSGLEPETRYYYSIGGSRVAPKRQFFDTAPVPGSVPQDGVSRFWILGDSGTANERKSSGALKHPGKQESVRDGFLKYNESQSDSGIDLILLLGDNAYPTGTEELWQTSHFEIYAELLKTIGSVPTIGNHEMGYGAVDICTFARVDACENGPVSQLIAGASMASDHMSYDGDGDGHPDGSGMPYFDIFTIPANGEIGGEPSGTEHYFSVDYANVHIVSLDSQLSINDLETWDGMKQWLIADLRENKMDWTVVLFHHPPYSKGENHDSDLEPSEIKMRTDFTPIFEQYGVDVVYNGHAHSYERSWYLSGHQGNSTTFDARVHAELDSEGKPSLGQSSNPYPQISASSNLDNKVVYVVTGGAGKVGVYDPCPAGEWIGCTTKTWLMHPAHRSFEPFESEILPNGIARLGSVVLEATETNLTSKFVDYNGEVLDYFIITRDHME